MAHIFLISKLTYIFSSANPVFALLKLAEERLHFQKEPFMKL